MKIRTLSYRFTGPRGKPLVHAIRILVMMHMVQFVVFIGGGVQLLYAQAMPTASRTGDLQIGTSFNLAQPDYSPQTFKGFGFYATFDFRKHLGLDAEFHQVIGKDDIYERTYEIGPRYVMHFGSLCPYAKLMVGRGVFNFPPAPNAPNSGPVANLAYNMWAGGLGVDYKIRPSLNLRVDYEFQQWNRFPPNGLAPQIFSVGVAYHFH